MSDDWKDIAARLTSVKLLAFALKGDGRDVTSLCAVFATHGREKQRIKIRFNQRRAYWRPTVLPMLFTLFFVSFGSVFCLPHDRLARLAIKA